MGWFHGGYWAAWYLAFTVIFCYFFPTHPEPAMLALACFLFIPGLLLGGYGGITVKLIADNTNAAVAEALARRTVTTWFLFLVGFVNGILAMIGVVSVWVLAYPYHTSEWSVLVVLLGSAAVALTTPLLGVAFLKKKYPPPPEKSLSELLH